MSDKTHILYTVISGVITAILLVACKFIKSEKNSIRVLKASAISTVILHYSSLYVDYFTTGTAEISNNMILPVYPCNIAMWLLLITAFVDTDKKIFKHLAITTFYLGVIGGVVGIVINENYIANPNLADWDILKGLLSHSTMLFGCLYLLTGKFVKIRVSNMFTILAGLLGMLLDGLLIIWLYRLFNLDPPNAMYLIEIPFESLPWLNTWVVGGFAIVVLFLITATVEQIFVAKGERWYDILKAKFKKQ